MSTAPDDFSKVNFDSHWRYCQHPIDKLDDVSISTFVSMHDYHHWSSVKLPHIDEQSDHSPVGTRHWWYRRHFHWIPSEQQLYLKFRLPDNHPNWSDSTMRIWLNQTQIFSGAFSLLQQPIGLPLHLLLDEESRNTLLIFCSNTTLCCHARLLIYGKLIYASGKIQLDDNKHVNQEDKEALHYTVALDDNDGRFALDFDSRDRLNDIEASPKSHVDPPQSSPSNEPSDDGVIPCLAIVILIVGTRGDVQPFIALGQALRAVGHRVRLATHETFRSFVRGNGLEFYPLAGDPADLMAFMVKNAGIIPSMSSIVAGDVARKRQSLADIMASTWQACTADDDETSLPFRAEAIIANPPSFGHIHCAEKLQIPLHIMFTMPWSRTRVFAHPLCNVDCMKGSADKINWYSYDTTELLTWNGMRDIVNKFRKDTLHLSTLHTRQAVRAMTYERVPHTYCWSPSIVPKPYDWGAHINVSGFFFLDLGTAYDNPSQDLLDFLGMNLSNTDQPKLPPPIYIGFGSITGHDASHLLSVIIEALNQTGYRALLTGFNIEMEHLSNNILPIGNVPHDWLFQHVSCVCHHGGAGTTAAGLRAGRPTIIVPFFGDQFFWGNVVERTGAGPRPLPGKSLTVDELIEAFHFAHASSTREAAERIRVALIEEDGCEAAVQAFHANLPLSRMRSDLESTFAACYRLEKYNLQISRPVAQVLVSAGMIEEEELSDHATREWQYSHSDKISVPSHGVVQHTSKAFSKIFVDTTKGVKAAVNHGHCVVGAKDIAGSVVKDIGLGLGHLSLGCLSLYGEITDKLDRTPALYDPYSNPPGHHRQQVTGMKSGIKAARKSLWYGWKEGVTGIVKEPYSGYHRYGKWGGAAGALLGTVNVLVKPATATLSSITWLGRGTYASVKKALKNADGSQVHSGASTPKSESSSPLIRDKQQHENSASDTDEQNGEISDVAKKAANESGFHPTICQHILTQFAQIKMNQEPLNDSGVPTDEVSYYSLRL